MNKGSVFKRTSDTQTLRVRAFTFQFVCFSIQQSVMYLCCCIIIFVHACFGRLCECQPTSVKHPIDDVAHEVQCTAAMSNLKGAMDDFKSEVQENFRNQELMIRHLSAPQQRRNDV